MSAELAALPVCELPAIDDGETFDLTPDEAEEITGRIRRWANSFPVDDVVRAFRGRIWVALAYDSWAEWCECELGGLKLPVPQRREVVAELAGQGMSNRAIADTIGVGHQTVSRDLSTGLNGPVDDAPRTTLGQDGRERSYPQPKPPTPEPELDEIVDAEIVDTPPAPAPPRRKPITEAFDSANYELKRAIERVVRLSEDDRLKKNKDQIVGANLSDLIRARDALAGVIQLLEG